MSRDMAGLVSGVSGIDPWTGPQPALSIARKTRSCHAFSDVSTATSAAFRSSLSVLPPGLSISIRYLFETVRANVPIGVSADTEPGANGTENEAAEKPSTGAVRTVQGSANKSSTSRRLRQKR